MSKAVVKKILVKNLWFIFLLIGLIGFITIWFFMPHQAEINSIFEIMYKLLIYFFICLGIAIFPNKYKNRYILIILLFVGFLGYINPKISYLGFDALQKDFEAYKGEFYTHLYLILYPAIVLSVCFAYRTGGGSPGKCIKIAICGQILLFSGFLDLMWYIINPVGIPKVLSYAHHIKIILGHFPTFGEGIIFTIAHIPFLILVIFLPLDKWLNKWKLSALFTYTE